VVLGFWPVSQIPGFRHFGANGFGGVAYPSRIPLGTSRSQKFCPWITGGEKMGNMGLDGSAAFIEFTKFTR
jgi:hypothetical protein